MGPLAEILYRGINRNQKKFLPLLNRIQDKEILITGGAGFIGTWICTFLIESGAKVTCVDNFSSSDPTNIRHLMENPRFAFIKHDVVDAFTELIPKKIDLIMHLASNASPYEFEHYPIAIIRANTVGLYNSLEVARQKNIPILFTSTSEIYGDPPENQIPTNEKYYGNVNPIGPRSCYDESKRCGEALVKAYEKEHDIDARIVRVFNTYGPFMQAGSSYGRVIPNFITQALKGQPLTIYGDGTQTRSFTYVMDEIEGILKAVLHPKAKGEVLNLGSNVETSIFDLAKLVIDLTQSTSEIRIKPQRIDDPKRRCPDITKAREILKWSLSTNLKKGLNLTIDWFRKRYQEDS